MATITEIGTRNISTDGGVETVTATPAVNDLIVVVAFQSNASNPVIAVTDNNSDGLGTTYHNAVHAWHSTPDRVAAIHVRTGLVGSATSTVFTMTPTGGTSTGGGLAVFKVTGMSKAGSAAVRQSGTHLNFAGTTPTINLGVAVLTTNPVIGCLCNQTNPATVTHQSSPAYTEAFDVGWATPTSGAEAMFINSGETASTIAWGGTSTLGDAALIELDASAAAATSLIVPTGIPRALLVR